MTISISLSVIISIATVLISLGAQYGFFMAFQKEAKNEIKKHDDRILVLEQHMTTHNLKISQLLDKIDSMKEISSSNWGKIFDKLDNFDKEIKLLTKDLYDKYTNLIIQNNDK